MKSQVHFKNCEKPVSTFIQSARIKLQIAVCWFTHPQLFRALLAAAQNGVEIRLILDFNQINFRPFGLNFKKLSQAGVQIRVHIGQTLLHHKFAIADEATILTGSYNWTSSETHDHVVAIFDPALARSFTRQFQKIWGSSVAFDAPGLPAPKVSTFAPQIRPFPATFEQLKKQIISGAKTWICRAKNETEWLDWLENSCHYLHLPAGKVPWPNNGSINPLWLQQIPLPASAKRKIKSYARANNGDVIIAVERSGVVLGAGILTSAPSFEASPNRRIKRTVNWLPAGAHLIKTTPPASPFTRCAGSSLALIQPFSSPSPG